MRGIVLYRLYFIKHHALLCKLRFFVKYRNKSNRKYCIRTKWISYDTILLFEKTYRNSPNSCVLFFYFGQYKICRLVLNGDFIYILCKKLIFLHIFGCY